jgi:hypothetical protein
VVFRGTAVFLAYAYGNRIEGVATSDSDLAISYHYGEHDQVDCAGFFTAPVRRPHGSPRRSFALKAISGNIRKPEAQAERGASVAAKFGCFAGTSSDGKCSRDVTSIHDDIVNSPIGSRLGLP